jgi:hypothetical protein
MYHRKQVIARLVNGFQELEAKSASIGDLLITSSASGMSSETFNKRLSSLQGNVLAELFPLGLRVTTRSEPGRIHCHAAVGLDFPVASFDWENFDGAQTWYRRYKASGSRLDLQRYKACTRAWRKSMPDQLRKLNQLLTQKARLYGFGRIHLLPVRKGNEALMYYLVGNVPVRRQRMDKGVRFFSSWGLSKMTGFKVMSPKYNAYRMKLKAFCESLGLTAEDYDVELKAVYGIGWHWRCFDVIKAMGKLTPALESKQQGMQRDLELHRLRKE